MTGLESFSLILSVVNEALSLVDRFLGSQKTVANKLDEREVARFRSACYAFSVAANQTFSEETRRSHLGHCEKIFLDCMHIGADSQLGPLPGGRVVAISSAALAAIYAKRGDKTLADRQFLIAFTNEPRLARERLFPKDYDATLRGQCEQRLDRLLQQEIEKADRKNYELRAAGDAAVQHLGVGFMLSNPHIPHNVKENLYRDMTKSTPQSSHQLRQEALRRVKDEFWRERERWLDEACRQVAREKLDQMGVVGEAQLPQK